MPTQKNSVTLMSNRSFETLIIITGNCTQNELDKVKSKLSTTERVIYVTELLEHITGLSRKDRERFISLDDLRDKSTTIRSAADTADRALKDARPFLDGYLSYKGKSLWLANETNFLHFHLLRLIDYINILNKTFSENVPGKIFCVGPVNNLTKVSELVADKKNISISVLSHEGLKSKISIFTWYAQKKLSKLSSLHISILYFAVFVRELLSSKEVPTIGDIQLTDSKSLNKNSKVVTILSTNKKQLDIVLRIYEYLSQMTGYDCRILNIKDDGIYEDLHSKGIRVSNMASYLKNSKVVKRHARRKFYYDVKKVFTNKKFQSFFIHANISYWPICGDHFIRNAMSNAPHLYSLAEGACTYFKQYPADIVITPGEWDSESRAIISAASIEGAKTVSVQRGDITDFPGWGGPLFSDIMTVNGASVEKAMVSLGVDSNQVVITGDPRLDKWVNDKDEIFTKDATQVELNIPEGKKMVAVMTNPVNLNEKASHAEDYISGLIEAGIEDDSLYFVIKLHPSEIDLDFYRRIQVRYKYKNLVVVKELNTPQLLYDADAVVTTISTTGEEAIFMGKPLVVINLTNEPDFMPYVGHPAAITVRKRQGISDALHKALNDADTNRHLAVGRNTYIEDHFYAADGNSAKRLEKVLQAFEL